jgi:hypothetical protein
MSTLRNTVRATGRTRRIARVVTALGIAATAGTLASLAACADAPSAPSAPASAQNRAVDAPRTSTGTTSGNPTVVMTALRRTQPLAADITYSVAYSPASGATLDVPEAGLHVVVPPGALPAKSKTTLSVTALAGNLVAYEFGPHGTKFNAALKVTQDLSNTTWAGNTGRADLSVGYFKSAALLDAVSGTAPIDEVLPLTVTGKMAHWDIWHFSGYMVSTGRSNAQY